ncbi:MAG: PadR family transcriptional regulator [Planctomycetota bacterium]
MGTAKRKTELLPGTLDMLVLKTLEPMALHGYAIARRIHQVTDEVLLVEEGSLYPALHRMEARGWIRARWGTSENNRRAKFYELTRDGRRQLRREVDAWQRLHEAVLRVLGARPSGAAG